MPPTVSIIVPAYNSSLFLSECLESCLRQTLSSFEVLCVDDGSTDTSLSIMHGYQEKDSRVKVLSQEHQGAAAARNYALAQACGKYIAFMDSDDYYPDRNALSLLVKAAQDNEVRIAGGSMCLDDNGVISFDSLHGKKMDSFSKAGLVDYEDYQYNYGYTRYVYEREMLEAAEISFPEYSMFEDPPFFVRAMIEAGSFYAIPDVVYCYRRSLHDEAGWTVQQACDRLYGLRDCLSISKEKGYALLHHHAAMQLEHEAIEGYMNNIQDSRVMSLIFSVSSLVDTSLIRTVYCDYPQYFVPGVIKVLVESSERLEAVLGSSTFKVGKIFLWLPSHIKSWLSSLFRSDGKM